MENSERAARLCKYCGAELRLAATFCENCKQNLAADAQPDLSRLPKCPVCKIPSYPAKINTHSVFHCEECEGTAVSKEAMMKLQAMEPKKMTKSELSRLHIRPPYFEKRDKPPFLICPFCGKKMLDCKMGPMNVDMCEKCGALWLERGKEKHLNEILGPYKMKRLNAGQGGRDRRR